ncbi:argininosuccinate synthase [Rhodothermus bifroesti]|uniref:argininosuccinate synthase n=1 Tax=Rhodothermus marinus TaxID=29549 RepID=A0A7V2F566_RHOMR|nr:argininosuccinate synthase [Rhodothermus bifroesti]GBD02411.1 Argininosuccinate synthase [bacterium HR18]
MSIVLAFSGGLDTSFCVPYLRETYKEPVYTVTVNTGGFTAEALAEIEALSQRLGAAGHFTLDGRYELFRDHLSYLIKGNVLRGGVYPLCVGPERIVQARKVVELARQLGARAIAHGSTGAGNDQVRFDVALRILADDLEILTPIRELGLSRAAATAYLRERGIAVPEKKTAYSINRGLWGTTIGGRETHTTTDPLPDEAYPDTVSPAQAPDTPLELTLTFTQGIPTALDGEALDPVTLIERLNQLGAAHGVGRGIHVGDTILGIKGRVGFEAPAALILITAHRELEKIVLTRWQRYQKDHLADFYGMLLHEGQYFDPVMRDIEAFLDSSQTVVTGTVGVRLFKGNIEVLGCDSPYSLFNARVATYGEQNRLWDGRDAQGFTRIYGVQALLAALVRKAATPSEIENQTAA